MFYKLTINTMDSILLFAYCITDGLFESMSPEQRTAIILSVETILQEGYSKPVETKKEFGI